MILCKAQNLPLLQAPLLGPSNDTFSGANRRYFRYGSTLSDFFDEARLSSVRVPSLSLQTP